MCQKMCEGCPFDLFSEKSAYFNNLGCLPGPSEIIKEMNETNKNWACHERSDKICRGLVQHVAEMNKPINLHIKKIHELHGSFLAKIDYSKELLIVDGIHK